VYVLPGYRGRGLGLELVRETVDGGLDGAPEVRWLLHTADAQRLYAKLGFTEERPLYPLMERGRRPPDSPEGAASARPQ
jgi:ribosomal protein S18 acetylase RimI-like enzyme